MPICCAVAYDLWARGFEARDISRASTDLEPERVAGTTTDEERRSIDCMVVIGWIRVAQSGEEKGGVQADTDVDR